MLQALTIFHVLIALSIIGLVLLQQGRGADAGTGLGGGASNTLFGARGSSSFLSRLTAICATLFFSTSLLLTYLGGKQESKAPDLMDVPVATGQQAPQDLPPVVTPAAPAAATKSDLPDPAAVKKVEPENKK